MRATYQPRELCWCSTLSMRRSHIKVKLALPPTCLQSVNDPVSLPFANALSARAQTGMGTCARSRSMYPSRSRSRRASAARTAGTPDKSRSSKNALEKKFLPHPLLTILILILSFNPFRPTLDRPIQSKTNFFQRPRHASHALRTCRGSIKNTHTTSNTTKIYVFTPVLNRFNLFTVLSAT